MILPELANVSCDEVGFPQGAVIPVPDMVRAAVELDEERDRPIPHMAPFAAIRRKELRLHQMLQERRLPNAAVPDNGDVVARLGTEIR